MSAVQVPNAPITLSTGSVYPEKTPRAFELAAHLGYDGVEIMVTPDPASQDIEVLRRLSDTRSGSCRCTHPACPPGGVNTTQG